MGLERHAFGRASRWHRPVLWLLRSLGRGTGAIRQKLNLLDMGDMDHRTVRHSTAPRTLSLLACERLGIDARNFQRVIVLAVDRNREVAMPILVEVEIDAARRFAYLGHHAFDELEAAGSNAQGGKSVQDTGVWPLLAQE